jgi:aldehyde dehydrogenase (NAD+)
LQGGRETNTLLLQQNFDVIFFTGSSEVGKIVMRAAAEHLTPVILELGGKSPCIVDANANIDVAAKRIIWGKLINAGQTCIAPDYLFAHASIKDELISKMLVHIEKMFGSNPQESKHYPRIVNERSFNRLSGFLAHGTIRVGGDNDIADLYFPPTIIDDVKPDFPVMQEEIFGPILPVLTFESITEPIEYINTHDKPLAFYYFGKKNGANKVLAQTSAGGGCINDTLMQIANHHLPFGGVGNSGLGKCHGKDSFLAFTNQKAVMTTTTWLDLSFKYPPFKWLKWVKKIV